MGTWGAAIFSDDTAADVRDEWRDYLGEGLSGQQATDKLLENWSGALDDPDDGPVFWLALAATQWKSGRLEDRVKTKALAFIDDESNLERWRENASLFKKRTAILAKLRAQLLSPQPAPKKIRKTIKATCDWDVGDVVSFRLKSGQLTLFRVIGKVTDHCGTYPECQFYDWTGQTTPSITEIHKLRIRPGVVMLCGSTMRDYPHDRIIRTGVKHPVDDLPEPWGVGVWLWGQIDWHVQQAWGLK